MGTIIQIRKTFSGIVTVEYFVRGICLKRFSGELDCSFRKTSVLIRKIPTLSRNILNYKLSDINLITACTVIA